MGRTAGPAAGTLAGRGAALEAHANPHEPTAQCLRRHRIAVCQSDAADWPLWSAVTTDLVYVRLHGHEVTCSSSYTGRQLAAWARRARRWVEQGRDVHFYFDNTDSGHATENARCLAEMLA